MGLDQNGIKLLLYARRKGVSFRETATIGRQSLLVDAVTLGRIFGSFGEETDHKELTSILNDSNGHADGLICKLGDGSVTSFDASDYEEADVIHDFNLPIPPEFINKFTLVIDGGTLEHVFNYPMALKNCMEMVRTGGHFLSISPANNFLGHGFYQFSPEMFARTLSSDNGFELEFMILYRDEADAQWYKVIDPIEAGGRVTLRNSWPTYIAALAKKVSEKNIFADYPQQSDYRMAWQDGEQNTSKNVRPNDESPGIFKKFGSGAKLLRKWMLAKLGDKPNSKHFEKIDPFD